MLGRILPSEDLMGRFLLFCLALAAGALALAAPALAQPASSNLNWDALDPGDDWSARVVIPNLSD